MEIAESDAAIYVRDSKDPDGPVLTFEPEAWRAFVSDVRTTANR